MKMENILVVARGQDGGEGKEVGVAIKAYKKEKEESSEIF